MPSYDPKANRPRLVPVDSSDEAPVDALLGPAEGDADSPAGDAPTPAPASAPQLTVVPDGPDAGAAPAPSPVTPGRPAAPTRPPTPTPTPTPTPPPAVTPAPAPSSGPSTKVVATAAVGAAVLACLVAWRGFARRRAAG